VASPAAAPVLAVDGLTVDFVTTDRVVHAVRDLSFTIDRGETIAVVGESGSGKSVTALSVMRLVEHGGGPIVQGRLRFARPGGTTVDLAQLDAKTMRDIRGAEIAMIFQEPMTSLNPVFPVGEQIAEQLRAHRKMTRKAARLHAIELLNEVGIPNPDRRVDEYPHEFSGGMRQRVMIAMALSCNPSLLIADEPTTALDVTIQAQILELMKRLRRDHGSSILIITHDMGVVSDLAERVVVMYAGGVVEEGPKQAVFREPQHPYTWGLLDSIPRVGRTRGRRLTVIPGQPPSLLAPPPGCRFAPRCIYRFPKCDERPALVAKVEPGHADACHLEPTSRPELRDERRTA
jgi:oligopeptide/dipeptide ABC transporter ATP-binding protein